MNKKMECWTLFSVSELTASWKSASKWSLYTTPPHFLYTLTHAFILSIRKTKTKLHFTMVTHMQKECLLDYMEDENHSKFAARQIMGFNHFYQRQQQLERLTSKLNRYGPSKSADGWDRVRIYTFINLIYYVSPAAIDRPPNMSLHRSQSQDQDHGTKL